MSSFKIIKKASKYADCKNSGKESLLKYYGVKTERRANIRSNLYLFQCVLIGLTERETFPKGAHGIYHNNIFNDKYTDESYILKITLEMQYFFIFLDDTNYR